MISSPELTLYGARLRSRLLLGTSQYPSPAILAEAARASGAEVLTVSSRRESARLKEGQDFWRLIRDIGARVLPNTAGCYSVKEAVDRSDGARGVRHAMGEARSDRRGRHPAARRVRPRRGGAILSRTASRSSPIRLRTSSSPSVSSKPGAKC